MKTSQKVDENTKNLREKIRNASKKIKKDIEHRRTSKEANKSMSSFTNHSESNSNLSKKPPDFGLGKTYMNSIKKRFGKKHEVEGNDGVPDVKLDLKHEGSKGLSKDSTKSSRARDTIGNNYSFTPANKTSQSLSSKAKLTSETCKNNQAQLNTDFSNTIDLIWQSSAAKGNFKGVNKLLNDNPELETSFKNQPGAYNREATQAQFFRDKMRQSKSYVKLTKALKTNRHRKSQNEGN